MYVPSPLRGWNSCLFTGEQRASVSQIPVRASLVLVLALSGCAVHYYDATTGTEHLWGFGHMRARISSMSEGIRAQATEVQMFGVSVDAGKEDYGLAAGYNRQGRLAICTNVAVRLEWYTRDLFRVRAGTNFPPDFTTHDQRKLKELK